MAKRSQFASPATTSATAPTPQNLVPDTFTNNDRLWLTYETIFNQKKFRKSNQPHNLGLFRIQLANVCIILRQDLHDSRSDALFKKLRACFLPQLEVLDGDMEQRKKYAPSPWNPAHPDAVRRDVSPSSVSITRTATTLYDDIWVVMPFNQRDHDGSVETIGLSSPTPHGHTIWPLNQALDMYNSASRSSVVKLKRIEVTEPDGWRPLTPMDSSSTPKALPPSAYWQLGSGGNTSDINGTAAFRLGTDATEFVSIKSGITHIGADDQLGKKAKLEEDSIVAAMRSDYIIEVDKRLGKDTFSDPDLLILSEVLTIVEPSPAPRAFRYAGDGFQVRDLRGLKPDKIYFPPISIPFVDTDLKALKKRYEVLTGNDQVAVKNWIDFWTIRFAQNIGRAKALLLLRYGLQSLTPNAQNFLIELNSDLRPTGRVVLRDVGDFLLHREAVWALWGDGSAPPQGDKKDVQARMVAGLQLDVLKYEWRPDGDQGLRGLFGLKLGENEYPVETGSNPDDAHSVSGGYPKHTQFHWHFYTSLGRGSSLIRAGTGSMDPEARNPGWQKVLWANALWGIAHNTAYIDCIRKCLGIDPGVNLAADPPPKPERYLALADPKDSSDTAPYVQADEYWREDNRWERRTAQHVHGKLCSEVGQKAIRDYKNRGWTPAQ